MGKLIDLKGKSFGRLTVIRLDEERMKKERAENPKKRQTYWICECECDKVKSVNSRDLKDGTTKSCGCLSVEIARSRCEDLIGKTFGYLTVIDRDWGKSRELNNDGGRKGTYWICECTCGAKVSRDSTTLKNSKNSSCGCRPRIIGHYRDLTGMAFGELTVLEIDWAKTKQTGKYHWRCECNCGNTVSIYSSNLISGGTKSCGCLIKKVTDAYYKNKAIEGNSVAHFLINTYGENALDIYWDYDKNKLNPYEVSRCGKDFIWIKCTEKDYHGSYKVKAANFFNDNRCPYCGHNKLHKYDSLGYVYPEILKVWSEKNKKTPYEYTVKSDSFVWLKCKDEVHEDYQSRVYNITAKNLVSSCQKCWEEFGLKENFSRENNPNWKGGVTNLKHYLRGVIKNWRMDSFVEYNNCCALTGSRKENVIHHTYQFEEMLYDTMCFLNLKIKEDVSEYTQSEIDSISTHFIELHYEYGLGICVDKEVHTLFHKTYGYRNTTKEDWKDFSENFHKGKYNNVC